MEKIDLLLRQWIGNAPFEGELKWCRGHLIDTRSGEFVSTLVNDKVRSVVFYYLAVLNGADAQPIYAIDIVDQAETLPEGKRKIEIAKGVLRPTYEPHHIRGLLGIYAIATPVLLGITLCLRLMQTVVIVIAIIFRVFKEFYPRHFEQNFPEHFVDVVDKKFNQQKAELKRIGEEVKLDFKMAIVMEVSALIGAFTQNLDYVMRMQIVFSKAELEWNKNIDPNRTPLSAFIRFWKQLDSHKNSLTSEFFFEKMQKMIEESESGFFLYQCAQPRSPDNQSRVRIIGEKNTQFFNSYADMELHIQTIIKQAEQQANS